VPPLWRPDENYHDHAATAAARKYALSCLKIYGGPPIQNKTSVAVQKTGVNRRWIRAPSKAPAGSGITGNVLSHALKTNCG
jgi:hypothetical protein